MKQLKLYIPIVTPRKSVTLIRASSCRELSKKIPSNGELLSYLMLQKQLVNKEREFVSYKISVPTEEMDIYRKEISSRITGKYISPVIDLILELGQKPLIQFIEKK